MNTQVDTQVDTQVIQLRMLPTRMSARILVQQDLLLEQYSNKISRWTGCRLRSSDLNAAEILDFLLTPDHSLDIATDRLDSEEITTELRALKKLVARCHNHVEGVRTNVQLHKLYIEALVICELTERQFAFSWRFTLTELQELTRDIDAACNAHEDIFCSYYMRPDPYIVDE